MERRKLLQGMLSLPVAAALGCRHKGNSQPPTVNAKPGTLKLYLHGPFAVVLNAKNHYRIKAFVPFDADGRHEFRFPTPDRVVSGEGEAGHRQHYEFTLQEEYLELSGSRPRIDAGFGDFQIHTGEWTPRPEEYFVSLDLPAPDVITFVPKAVVPVAFANGNLGMMPLDHILEYKVRNSKSMEKIRLHSPQLKGDPMNDHQPWTCQTMLSRHSETMREARGMNQNNAGLRPYLEPEFKQCDQLEIGAFFLGVGLSPKGFSVQDAKAHALNFFNGKLLAAFPNAPERAGLELQAVDVKPCTTSGNTFTPPTFMPAVQRYSVPTPHFRQVSSFEDCRAGGLIGTTP